MSLSIVVVSCVSKQDWTAADLLIEVLIEKRVQGQFLDCCKFLSVEVLSCASKNVKMHKC